VSGVEFNGGITLNTLATVAGLRVEDLKKMSTEEIARTLEKLGGNGKQGGERGDINGDLLEGEVNGETVQEGDRSVSKAKTREDIKQAWKRLCEKAKAFAKQAGTMPAGLERIVDEVLDVKPPWHITLRFGLRNSSRFDSSYAHPSRRGDDYPGQYGYRYTVYALVDTSGSIREDELKLFLGIIKHEARQAQVFAIPWDADAFEVLKAERPADVARKIARKMRGGGGTVCLPVLKKVHRLMKGGDAVIMLSDGDIADENNTETQEWFRKVSAKAGFSMIGYTHKPVTAPGFATANIDFHSLSF
jgi:predicted metal-dependent peptidase